MPSKSEQVRHQDACTTNAGVQLKLRATPSPPFQKQHFRRSLYDTNSTQGIENDVSARLPDITLDSCDRDLWPPNPRGRPSMPLPRWKICANLHWNRFTHFQSIAFTSWWQTNERTDEGTGREHYAYGKSRLEHGKYSICHRWKTLEKNENRR